MKRWLAFLGLLVSQVAPAATVQLTTPDGLSIHAETAGTGKHAVLLVHGWGQASTDWTALNQRLASHDFFVLALDLRGHGQSAASDELNEDDCTPMKADLEAALEWLQQRNPTSLSVVGAELGANLALQVASSHEAVSNVVLLSPGLNHCGVKVGAAIAAYTHRPILFVASETDVTSKKAATLLQAKATGPSHLELIPGSARGTRLLNASPQLESVLVGWLNGSMWQDSAALNQPLLTPSSNPNIETTGTRLEDRH
jgi:dienelactone hydrolase